MQHHFSSPPFFPDTPKTSEPAGRLNSIEITAIIKIIPYYFDVLPHEQGKTTTATVNSTNLDGNFSFEWHPKHKSKSSHSLQWNRVPTIKLRHSSHLYLDDRKEINYQMFGCKRNVFSKYQDESIFWIHSKRKLKN